MPKIKLFWLKFSEYVIIIVFLLSWFGLCQDIVDIDEILNNMSLEKLPCKVLH